MDGVGIIRALLVAASGVTDLVPEDRIEAGDLPRGVELPAIAITSVSSVDRNILKPGAKRHVTERVQVTVMAKRYPEQRAVLRAVKAAAADFIGSIASLSDVTVHTEVAGPDITDDQASIRIGSQDFMVGFTESGPPRPIAVADFKNGNYSIGGVAKAREELFGPVTVAFSTTAPDGSIVPGTGWVGPAGPTSNGYALQATDGLAALLDIQGAGFTAVVEYSMEASGSEPANLILEALDPTWTYAWEVNVTGGNGIYLDEATDYEGHDVLRHGVSVGSGKLAVTFSPGLVASSLNGRVALQIDPNNRASIDHFVPAISSSDSSSVTVRKVTLYAAQPVDVLEAQSA